MKAEWRIVGWADDEWEPFEDYHEDTPLKKLLANLDEAYPGGNLEVRICKQEVNP